jgi:hypothetical protein
MPAITNNIKNIEAPYFLFHFNPESFYSEWTKKYFGDNVSAEIVAILKLTHEANLPIGGFRNTMNNSVKLLNKIENKEYGVVSSSELDSSLIPAEKAFQLSQKLIPAIKGMKQTSFIDQVAYPAEIFYLNLKFLKSITDLNNALAVKNTSRSVIIQKGEKMKSVLIELRDKLDAGSGWDKWKDFYKPENFRIHTPPPTMESIGKIISAI